MTSVGVRSAARSRSGFATATLAGSLPVRRAQLLGMPQVGVVREHRRPVEAARVADVGLVAAGHAAGSSTRPCSRRSCRPVANTRFGSTHGCLSSSRSRFPRPAVPELAPTPVIESTKRFRSSTSRGSSRRRRRSPATPSPGGSSASASCRHGGVRAAVDQPASAAPAGLLPPGRSRAGGRATSGRDSPSAPSYQGCFDLAEAQ